MTLFYIKGSNPLPFEAKKLETVEGNCFVRNASLWKGEVEQDFDLVYTDDDAIKAAYETAGITCKPYAAKAPAKPKRKAAAKKA